MLSIALHMSSGVCLGKTADAKRASPVSGVGHPSWEWQSGEL